MANFKKISEVDVLNTITASDNVVIIGSDGNLKQTASSNLGTDLTKAELVEAPAENDTLVLVSDGVVKQVSAASFAAASGGGGSNICIVMDYVPENYGTVDVTTCNLLDGSPIPDDLYNLFLNGTNIIVKINMLDSYGDEIGSCMGVCTRVSNTISGGMTALSFDIEPEPGNWISFYLNQYI